MKILQLAAAIAALPLALAAVDAKADKISVTFSSNYRNGVCFAGVNGGSGATAFKLQFSRRVRDGNFGVSIDMASWPLAREKDPEANYPVTIAFDTGTKVTTRSGGYEGGGFSEGLWGGFGPGPASDEAYAALADASSATVSMDGHSFGPVDLQMKGLLYNSLDRCAQDHAGG